MHGKTIPHYILPLHTGKRLVHSPYLLLMAETLDRRTQKKKRRTTHAQPPPPLLLAIRLLSLSHRSQYTQAAPLMMAVRQVTLLNETQH